MDIWKACLDGVCDRDDGGLSDVSVFHKHALNLGRGHQVPGAVQHVVNTTCHRGPPVRTGQGQNDEEKKVAGISSNQKNYVKVENKEFKQKSIPCVLKVSC